MNIERGRSHLKTQPEMEQPDIGEEAFVTEDDTDRPKSHNRLQDLRRDASMSRREVAKDLNITPAVLASIERGNTEPGVMLAWTFARYFELPLEKIFSEDPLPTLTEILKSSCGCTTLTAGSH